MAKLPQPRIIGIVVSQDWLDINCLPADQPMRPANKLEGHGQVAQRALELGAMVCFGATGGQKWRLWAALDAAGHQDTAMATCTDESLRCQSQTWHAGQNRPDRRRANRPIHGLGQYVLVDHNTALDE